MGEGKRNNNSGMPFVFMLFIMFAICFTLKLCGVIDWSWFWVTSFLWFPIAFAAVALFVCILVGAVLGIAQSIKNKKDK